MNYSRLDFDMEQPRNAVRLFGQTANWWSFDRGETTFDLTIPMI